RCARPRSPRANRRRTRRTGRRPGGRGRGGDGQVRRSWAEPKSSRHRRPLPTGSRTWQHKGEGPPVTMQPMTSASDSPSGAATPRGAGAIDIHTTAGKLADLRNRMEEAKQPVGPEAVERVHAKGKLTARERITELLDEGSFVEIDALA